MALRIHQQFGQIGLNIKKPFLNLEIRPQRFEVKTSLPKVSIHHELAPLKIDQQEFFATLGYRNLRQIAQHFLSIAKSAVLEGIGRRAAEGDMLGAIEKNISVADIARMNADRYVESNLVFPGPAPAPEVDVPRVPVKVDVEPGRLDVNNVKGNVKVKLDWGQVNVYLKQKPYLQLEYTGKMIDAVV